MSSFEIQMWPEHPMVRCNDFGLIVPDWLKDNKIYTTCLWAGMDTRVVSLRYFKHFLKHTFNIEMDLSEYGTTDFDGAC